MLIFLSMAAMDKEKMVENRWLPTDLFPLLYQRIAASGGPYDCDELPWQDRQRNAGEGRGLAVRRVIGKTYVYKFKDWFHKKFLQLGKRKLHEACPPGGLGKERTPSGYILLYGKDGKVVSKKIFRKGLTERITYSILVTLKNLLYTCFRGSVGRAIDS